MQQDHPSIDIEQAQIAAVKLSEQLVGLYGRPSSNFFSSQAKVAASFCEFLTSDLTCAPLNLRIQTIQSAISTAKEHQKNSLDGDFENSWLYVYFQKPTFETSSNPDRRIELAAFHSKITGLDWSRSLQKGAQECLKELGFKTEANKDIDSVFITVNPPGSVELYGTNQTDALEVSVPDMPGVKGFREGRQPEPLSRKFEPS